MLASSSARWNFTHIDQESSNYSTDASSVAPPISLRFIEIEGFIFIFAGFHATE